MRRIFSLLSLPAVAGVMLTASCSKQNQDQVVPAAAPRIHPAARLAAPGLSDQIRVSPYGFLVLDDEPSLSAYTAFLYENTAADITAFHNSINFTSQVAVAGQAGNQIPGSAENGEYLFNQNGIVQIGSMLIRGVNDQGYLLVMPVSNLNTANYEKLATKTFDPGVMSKLKIGGEYLPDLETYVNDNPGHDGTGDPVVPPSGSRIFWGWIHEYGRFDPKGTLSWDAKYIFWIRVKTKNYGVE